MKILIHRSIAVIDTIKNYIERSGGNKGGIMRKYLSLFASFLFIFLSSEGIAAKVIVNIWDGCQYDILQSLYDRGQLPNARSVGPTFHLTSNADCFDTNARCKCMAITTKTQIATMLTGVLADVHGVYNNKPGCFHEVPKDLTVVSFR